MLITLMLTGGTPCVVAVALMIIDSVSVIRGGQTFRFRQIRSRSTPVLTASAVARLVGLIVFCGGAFLPVSSPSVRRQSCGGTLVGNLRRVICVLRLGEMVSPRYGGPHRGDHPAHGVDDLLVAEP